jgi:hypothetical protein
MVTSDLFVEPNQHYAIVGPTGSGKTVLVNELATYYDNVTILDPKHKWDWTLPDSNGKNPMRPNRVGTRWSHVAYSFKDLEKKWKRIAKIDDEENPEYGAPIVYRPPKRELLKQNSHELDRVAGGILDRGNTVYIVDETAYIANATDFQERAPNFYLLLATGRGLGIGVWCCMQRPRRIPTSALSETEKRITFYLAKAADRKAVEEDLLADVPWEKLREHDHSFVVGTDRFTSGPKRLIL